MKFLYWIMRKLEKVGLPWHKFSESLALLSILAIEEEMKRKNNKNPADPKITVPPRPKCPIDYFSRSVDGSFTDIDKPLMGAANTCFGRNVEGNPSETDTLLKPNPRVVSQKLLARKEFKPAKIVNLLAAAWIQFQIHGWVNHIHDHSHWLEIPVDENDPWAHEKPIRVPSTKKTPTEGDVPAHPNSVSHWWAASQIYGYSEAGMKSIRSFKHGKLTIGKDGLLPLDPRDNIDNTGMKVNWWLGLSMIHTLFTLEHNTICDHLARENPTWDDEMLYRKARLINVALMSKIHTIEWTPAIVPNPTVVTGLFANWEGFHKQGKKLLTKIFKHDKARCYGIMGSPRDYSGADYSLTEDFVSVYRMHPLIPDALTCRSVKDDSLIATHKMIDLAGVNARQKVQSYIAMEDLFYSFGVAHPGALELHNYPDFLRDLQPQPQDPDDPLQPRIDLAAVEILRDRERGMKRYCEFLRGLGKVPPKNFVQLTGGNRELAKEISDVYDGKIEDVDLLVGLFAEPKPVGFGFSDTAFRIFILMATRRLQCDRFYTDYYNKKIYSPVGIKWVEDNSMVSVLLRHYPSLVPALKDVNNAFKPWTPISTYGS